MLFTLLNLVSFLDSEKRLSAFLDFLLKIVVCYVPIAIVFQGKSQALWNSILPKSLINSASFTEYASKA